MTEHVEHELGPYALVPLWLLEALIDAKSKALPLYVALHRWTSGADRSCYPSRQTLAKYLGVSVDTVDRWSADLQTIGAITVQRRFTEDGDPTSNLYTLRVTRPGSRTDTAGGGSTDAAGGGGTDAALTKPSDNQTHLNQTHTHTGDIVTSEPVTSFESFWNLYPRKEGRQTASSRWGKMTDSERVAAFEALRDWCAYYATIESRFIPHGSTWLNQRRWEDELPDTPVTLTVVPSVPVGCDECDGTGWVEVDDPTLRSGRGVVKCQCQTLDNVDKRE